MVRNRGFGVCLVGLSLVLSGCDRLGSGGKSGDQTSQNEASWTRATARQLADAINGRAAHALDHVAFETGGDPGSSEGDAALTRAALAYAKALAQGASDPTRLYEHYTVRRPKPDLKAGLTLALQRGDVKGWLESLAPADGNYRRLSQAYLEIVRRPPAPTPTIPDAGKPITPGSTDARIPLIARQLIAMDYLDPRFAGERRYSRPLVAAVRSLQAEYGINPDGIIGSEALTILTLSDADRARAIAVAMERLRWLEREPPATRIDVNLAAARLTYWRDGKIADSRKVVVGEPDKQTPQLGSPIFQLVANPTWTVPRSIEESELADKGAAYLSANNMIRKDGWIVQQPGPTNSLGLVKFDMANDQAIYLHDTPAKALFGTVQRQRSHGCVRVYDALGFADRIARDEGIDKEWADARATGEETFVKLPHRIPVRMLYQTVLFGDDGEPIIRNDPYNWNDRVAVALGFTASQTRGLKTGKGDVGP